MNVRRVRVALLCAFLLHGLFILTARYRLSYDAYTHMFFADHYLRDWWSLWEPRWFGGFTVVTYPPLVHQILGLLGHLIGVDAAYAAVCWTVVTAYPLGVYAFSRIFCGRSASGFAALGAALLCSIYYSAYAFGQLPTLAAALFTLFAMAALAEYLRTGRRLSGALAVALIAVVAASHHATLLLLPWAVGAVFLHILLNETPDRAALFKRLASFALFSILAASFVIWPFWAWGLGQEIQTPIDHLSRHSFLQDPYGLVAFFLPMYGPLIVFIPFAFWLARSRRYVALSLAFFILLLLGLGGTTPLPRWLFGRGWVWLTYDRFALWATFFLLPFFGSAMVLARRWLPGLVSVKLELVARRDRKPWLDLRSRVNPRNWASTITLGIFALVALIAGFIPNILHTQPETVSMQPIVDFLADDDRAHWRYVTFGFGDQFAYLSRLTDATTIDGSYFTARTLPELRASGIGQIDMALWSAEGLPALDPILRASSERGVRWAFVARREYAPVLRRNGWVPTRALSNGIQVWENPAAALPPADASPAADPLATFSWGALPLLALYLAAALAGLRLRPVATRQTLAGIHWFAIGLLPISLVFWYFRALTEIQHRYVYFVYDNALFYLSDALAVIAVLTSALERAFEPKSVLDSEAPRRPFDVMQLLSSLTPWLLALCILASLSILWSVDRRISLYVSLHLWLVFGLYRSLQQRPQVWRAFAYGSCTALVLQIFFGGMEFAAQSTAALAPLALKWLPAIEPAMPGVSVVMAYDATRVLRVYGSLPHPNILASMIVAFLAGPVAVFVRGKRRDIWMPILFGLSAALLVLTFSRAAWIGLAVAAMVVIVRRAAFDSGRLIVLALVGSIGLAAVALPLSEYVLIRVTNGPVHTEQVSWGMRMWLAQRALTMIGRHPLLGVGIGAHTITSARDMVRDIADVPDDVIVEPVHNLPLLVQSELGLLGTAILIGLAVTLVRGSLHARRPEAIVISAAVLGLCAIGLFDHALWTLAPGRVLFAAMLGLWAGLVRPEE
ncbi:MAG TPA: O-antigen ligase family protein [Anaerolineales bacterium]|jgi:O-antigen ligase